MENWQKDFGPFENKIWLNTASEGPLPRVAVEELQEAVNWKIRPYELTHQRFREIPKRLKNAIGRLINIPENDIILGNSATYGIHLLANGLPFKKDDEILLMQNDFPTDIVPWLALRKKGIIVREIKPQGHVLQFEELLFHITSKTKLICLSHVHTFTGHMIDVKKIGIACRDRKIIFVVNFTQTLGNMPVNLAEFPVDAITCSGFKWLCGPYGTGFCWIHPDVRATLEYNHCLWSNVMTADDLEKTDAITLTESREAARYDVFGTANFFNFVPWRASLDYLLKIGLERIHRHNAQLIDRFIMGLDKNQFNLISPPEAERRSGLIVMTHKSAEGNKKIFHSLIKTGIFPALWKGNLRFSPHIFNTKDDIDKTLTFLNSWRD